MEYTQFKPIRTSAPRPDPQPLARQDSGSEEPGFFSRLFGLGRPDKTGPTEAPAPAKAKEEEQQGPVARPWMPDNVVSRCHSCDLHFTAVRRRHHCRVCGQIFCNACADNYLDRSYFGFADHEVIRVCNFCFQGRRQQLELLKMGEESLGPRGRQSPRVPTQIDAFGRRLPSMQSDGEYSDSGAPEPPVASNIAQLGSSGNRSANISGIIGKASDSFSILSDEEMDDGPLSFWEDESVPSYPIDRRPSSFSSLSMALPNSSFSAGSEATSLRPEARSHLDNIVGTLLRRDEDKTGLNEGIWVHTLVELAINATRKTQLSIENDLMDVTQYVRVKVVPGGSKSESHYIPGLILKKTVSLKGMRSRLEQPRVLLMGCAVEFSRPDWRFVAFDVLQVQEKDFLRILVDRITAKKPDVLITSETISFLALDFLQAAGITCITRVKKTSLERLSRFTGASIVSTLADIPSAVVGINCGKLLDHRFITPSGRRNVLIFDHCRPKSGGTVLLRGEDTHNLHVLKKVLLFAIYTAYHLRLEGALINDLSLHQMGRKGSTLESMEDSSLAAPSSVSPGVFFPPARSDDAPAVVMEVENEKKRAARRASELRPYPDLVAIHDRMGGWSRALNYDLEDTIDMMQRQKKEDRSQMQTLAGGNTDDILENQSIVYSFTQHHAGKRSHCVIYQPHLIEFYSRNDMPLNLFLQWCRNTSLCPVNNCQRPAHEHETSILYSKYRLFISTTPLPASVRAPKKDEILCWFGCNECMEASEPRTLSYQSQSLSFGKLLELVFLDSSLSCSVGHRLNPSGTLAFATQGKLTSVAFLRSPVFSVVAPPLNQRFNLELEHEMVERELTSLAAAAHATYGVVKRFVDGAALREALDREEGDFLQSINDAKHSRLLEINRLFRTLFTNVMRWQGLYEETASTAGGSDSSMEYGAPGNGSNGSSTNSLGNLASPSSASGSGSESSLRVSVEGLVGLRRSNSNVRLSAPSSPRLQGSDPSLSANNSAMPTPTMRPLMAASNSSASAADASVTQKIVNVIRKTTPASLQQLICDEISSTMDKKGTMYQLFCGRGAPMPLSPLTNEFVIVLDREPSTHIACALGTDSYREQMHSILGPMLRKQMNQEGGLDDTETLDFEKMPEDLLVKLAMQATQKDMKVSFESMLPRLHYTCDVTIYYPLQFAALRRLFCGGDSSFVHSMARSQSWEAKEQGGGGSRATFVNTLDSLFLLKSVPSVELKNFQAFAAKYFEYMLAALRGESPTLMVKIIGMFSIETKNPTGQSIRQDFIVMEKLFHDRQISRTFDLKGSLRNRLRPDSAVVLQDENLRRMMWSSPLVIDDVSKAELSLAIWKDTSFLADVSVMDYSILVGVDDKAQVIAVGLIDYIRPYSWDKMVEYVMKATISGQQKPTILSPMLYRDRFVKFTWHCFVLAPDRNALVLLDNKGAETKEEQVPVVVMGFEE